MLYQLPISNFVTKMICLDADSIIMGKNVEYEDDKEIQRLINGKVTVKE